MNKNEIYRTLPKVDDLLKLDSIENLSQKVPNIIINQSISEVLDKYRELIKLTNDDELDKIDISIDTIVNKILITAEFLYSDKLKPLVNASGVVIHTNLGRSVLSKEIVEKAINNSCKYSNLEFDLENGKRGSRYNHLEDLICKVTGAEAAHVVNNNASAVILVLNELASGKNIPVSRGELVEIGGSFRIPEIMKISKCELKEIGCTNKTHISDYEDVIDDETALILKVHSSNYKILGFSETPSLEELSILAKKKKIPLYYDIGSGSIIDMSKFKSFEEHIDEPTVNEALKYADIVSFSGDKLLGSAQAGIIVGKKEYIERMKKNQLTRALRLDKIIISILEQSFKSYLDEDKLFEKNPTLRMLKMTKAETEERAYKLIRLLDGLKDDYTFELIDDYSEVGGGSLPTSKLKSTVVSIESKNMSADKLLQKLRENEPPIIARIKKDKLIIDTRTLLDGDGDIIVRALS